MKPLRSDQVGIQYTLGIAINSINTEAELLGWVLSCGEREVRDGHFVSVISQI